MIGFAFYLIAGATLTPAHASALADALNRATARMTGDQRVAAPDQRAAVGALSLKVVATVQAGRPAPIVPDADDARAWVDLAAHFGPAFIDAGAARARTLALLNRFLTDADRVELRRAYPALAHATFDRRPGVRAPLVFARHADLGMDRAATVAAFGRRAVWQAEAAAFVHARLGFARRRFTEDVTLALTLHALAKYLDVPTEAGFCAKMLIDQRAG